MRKQNAPVPPRGYLHPLYAQSFSEMGTPLYLPKCGGWLIKREIPGTDYYDAMGPYPLFFCQDWEALTEDLSGLADQLVSVTLVVGPLVDFPEAAYEAYFEIFTPYKDHYLLDLEMPLNKSISKNKRRNARRALRELDVQLQVAPDVDLDEWVKLYECLIERHQITGIRAFSKRSFEKQVAIPNTHYFRVLHQGEPVGGNLYYLQGDQAYAHLSAFTEEGYQLGAPYAVKWAALQHLAKLTRWVNFGGSTASEGDAPDGLDKFKQGWSNTTAKSYLCGKILNPQIYQQLASDKDAGGWFPAYRAGDF